MLACKSFKQSSTRLCEAIARMTKTLRTQYIDPTTIEALIASRLIPLDKGEGAVRPIGVGELISRISAKCVMSFAKKDVLDASGSLQLCAGQKSGSEAAIHAMNTLFEADDIDAVLLIDASNTFNSLNRTVALHNIRVLSSIIAAYAINTPQTACSAVYCWRQRDCVSRRNNTRISIGNGLLCDKYRAFDNQFTGRIYCEAVLVRRRCEWSWSCDINQRLVGCIECSWSNLVLRAFFENSAMGKGHGTGCSFTYSDLVNDIYISMQSWINLFTLLDKLTFSR